ncbi:MAG: hypothetical protein AAFR70_11905 [Pseudomonadota bacterium]
MQNHAINARFGASRLIEVLARQARRRRLKRTLHRLGPQLVEDTVISEAHALRALDQY